MYDIAIIGLGPAGATLARLLGGDFRVVAIDKKLPAAGGAGFKKPCGGLLAPDAQKALSRHGLALPKDVLVDPQIFAVRTVDTARNLQRYYQRFYVNLDRDKFDRWLISLIPGGVEVMGGAVCTGISRGADGYDVSYTRGGEARRVRARCVVGADGANSQVRRTLFPERDIRRHVAVQQWFAERNRSPFYSCVFDPAVTDSYCWSISKDGFFILGGAFPPRRARAGFALLKEKIASRGYEFGEPLKTEACLVAMPRGPRDFYTGRGGAFLLGEAAGFISPSSLEGISFALDSACELAAVLNARAKNPDAAYRAATLRIRAALLLKLLKMPFMYRGLPRALIMKSGINSISVH